MRLSLHQSRPWMAASACSSPKQLCGCAYSFRIRAMLWHSLAAILLLFTWSMAVDAKVWNACLLEHLQSQAWALSKASTRCHSAGNCAVLQFAPDLVQIVTTDDEGSLGYLIIYAL
eukprot:364282-Chlamydomonas_euryale.AAC.53